MLFNSNFFIFVFLPVALFVYLALGSLSRTWALRWIIVASLIFYAWWRPENVFIIVPAMLVNYCLARFILHFRNIGKENLSRLTLGVGILFNIAVLGYFKYTNFALQTANDLFGSSFTFEQIVLPLGISFITFQKIAFLIDVHGKRVESFRFQDFFSFVLFFPQLIAGPIVHYREMMPQFHAAQCKWDSNDISVGLTLFFFGLFKKVVLADGIAPMVTSIYSAADAGDAISMIPAWLAGLGFTFQIYFDFSAYSDMALGAARLFGIRLPVNFNSPLKSSSIIDFWLRWHVSLTRFLTAYIYNPISLFLTRRRLASGRTAYGGRNTSTGAFLQLLMLPTMLTMLVSGVWHGAGYQFLVWGLLHGTYLTANHGWRLFTQRRWRKSTTYEHIMRPLGFILTFTAVVVSMVIFRSSDMTSATNIIAGMVGLNGITLPDSIVSRLGSIGPILATFGVTSGTPEYLDLMGLLKWLALLAPIALLLPNTLQVMDHFEPAIGIVASGEKNFFRFNIHWRTNITWTLLLAVVAFFAVSNIGGYTEFLYWQF